MLLLVKLTYYLEENLNNFVVYVKQMRFVQVNIFLSYNINFLFRLNRQQLLETQSHLIVI
jgi:hypothetical protein